LEFSPTSVGPLFFGKNVSAIAGGHFFSTNFELGVLRLIATVGLFQKTSAHRGSAIYCAGQG
jgi:hypothetical protein